MLKEQEAGMVTADVCRKHGVSTATSCKCRARFGGLEVSEPRHLGALADEDSKLRTLPAEAMLERASEGAIGSSPTARAILKDVASRKW